MHELSDLLRPSWDAEQWILEGWNRISLDEKALIKNRMDELFKDGLPFELKHDKLLYIYAFSLLAQLEVLAIQVPLKFEASMPSPEFKEQMHVQLLDEIFHGMVFTKIVYLLCAPQALPPAYNKNIEVLCNFIRHEDCPKIGIVLLNLIGEGWIEEIFYSFQKQNIAPKVFEMILLDEHRHVCEADLYRIIGMPDQTILREKLEYLEEQLITNIFLQYKYVQSIHTLLGSDGINQFMSSLNAKHIQQLNKINLKPSDKWVYYMKMIQSIFPKIQQYSMSNHEIPMTPLRQVFMTQWDNPSDPTMVGEFNINVSCIDFFNKKFPPETITTLMLKTISYGLMQNESFRNYISHSKLWQSKEAYVGIVVKLPDCGDHIGTILFKNCHEMTTSELASRIRIIQQMMVYCFKKREELEIANPHFKQINTNILYEFANGMYQYPIPGSSVVALSNIGHCGYSQSKSPLRSNECMKFTLLEIDRKQVWNKHTQSFEIQDVLPVSISADHRIFDGNLPVPRLVSDAFHHMFRLMIENEQIESVSSNQNNESFATKLYNQSVTSHYKKLLDTLLDNNVELGYKLLTALQTVWPDHMDIDELFVG